MEEKKSTTSEDMENFRMLHQLQYERIDKIQTSRENFSNYVLTISSGLYLLAIPNLSEINYKNFILITSFIILINIVAIIFSHNSRKFVKFHQKRAKKMRKAFIIEIHSTLYSNKKPNVKGLNRNNLYKILHCLIITFSILFCAVNLCDKKYQHVQKIKRIEIDLKND